MSLYRLSISLHCWPTKRQERRRPDVKPLIALPDDRPVQRINVFDQVLDGDDRRDLEYFDTRLHEGLIAAAGRLRAISRFRLDQLRDIGYATRIEVSVSAEPGEIDFEIPAEFIHACAELELGVQVTSDQMVLVDPTSSRLFKGELEMEELKASDLL